MPLTRPRVGDPAPAIELLDQTGQTWRLEDHRGRAQLLIFHRHAH